MTKQGLCQLQLLADSGSELKGMKIRGTSSVQNKGRRRGEVDRGKESQIDDERRKFNFRL